MTEQERDDTTGGDVAVGPGTPGGTALAVLEYLANQIVDDPSSVRIEADQTSGGMTLRLHVASDDMGKVIGKRGRVAQSIRTLVRAAGARDGIAVNVDIVD
ncbi:MAG: KH domain-containing protein [Acidimicrobiales bacterium]